MLGKHARIGFKDLGLGVGEKGSKKHPAFWAGLGFRAGSRIKLQGPHTTKSDQKISDIDQDKLQARTLLCQQ